MRPLCVVLLSTAARYGTPTPPDIASQYWRLAGNLHVQLMAGTHDGIIPPVNVQRHYQAMQAAGMKVSQSTCVASGGLSAVLVGWRSIGKAASWSQLIIMGQHLSVVWCQVVAKGILAEGVTAPVPVPWSTLEP
jgi:hypothetical protein